MRNFVRNFGKLASFHALTLSCFVHIYGKSSCPHCILAEKMLAKCVAKVIFHDIDKSYVDRQRVSLMMEERGLALRTVPQIFFCKEHVGGHAELRRLRSGKELNKTLTENGIKHTDCEA